MIAIAVLMIAARHRAEVKVLVEGAARSAASVHSGNYFRVARNPSSIYAKRGDHFRQADFAGLIGTVEAGYLPVSRLFA